MAGVDLEGRHRGGGTNTGNKQGKLLMMLNNQSVCILIMLAKSYIAR